MTSEVHIETMNIESEDSTMLDDSEFEGFSDSESSETANNNRFIINDSFTILLESNRLLQQILLNHASRKQKVYIFMPEKFNEKVEDFIEAWLEQFETWFRHREQVEKSIDDHIRIETSIQNTKSNINLDLIRHKTDHE